MNPEIFKSFLQRCVENQLNVGIITSISGKSENGYYEGVVTEFDDEALSLSIGIEGERTLIVSRKYIVSISEMEGVKEKPSLLDEEKSQIHKQWTKMVEKTKASEYVLKSIPPNF